MTRDSEEKLDVAYAVETLGDELLFPRPSPRQLAEFERLSDSLLNLSRGRDEGCTVVFSSSVRGEGCSFISYHAARHLSVMLGSKVAWVDGNFVSPQRRMMGRGVGFRELLQDPRRIEEVGSGPNFVTVPHGEVEIKQTKLLSSDRYEKLLKAFERTFQFTIIDAPAISDSVDVGRFSLPTLGVVLVVETRRLKYEVIRHSIETIRSQGGRVLGTVLNKQSFDIPNFLYRRFMGL